MTTMLSILVGEHIEISEALNIDFESQKCDLKKFHNTNLNAISLFTIGRTCFSVVLSQSNTSNEKLQTHFSTVECVEKN